MRFRLARLRFDRVDALGPYTARRSSPPTSRMVRQSRRPADRRDGAGAGASAPSRRRGGSACASGPRLAVVTGRPSPPRSASWTTMVARKAQAGSPIKRRATALPARSWRWRVGRRTSSLRSRVAEPFQAATVLLLKPLALAAGSCSANTVSEHMLLVFGCARQRGGADGAGSRRSSPSRSAPWSCSGLLRGLAARRSPQPIGRSGAGALAARLTGYFLRCGDSGTPPRDGVDDRRIALLLQGDAGGLALPVLAGVLVHGPLAAAFCGRAPSRLADGLAAL